MPLIAPFDSAMSDCISHQKLQTWALELGMRFFKFLIIALGLRILFLRFLP